MGKGKGLGARTVKPRTEAVRICTDGELVGELRHLERDLIRAEREDADANRTPQAPKIAQQIRDLEEAAEEATVELMLRGIGDRAWRQLLADHPPTKQQIAAAKADGVKKPEYDRDVFPHEAVAASIVTINGEEADETAETVREFFEHLPGGEFDRVWSLALIVNMGDNSVPFSYRASRHLTGSAPSSPSAEPTD